MSQETQIGNLGGGISEEDSRLVDSILQQMAQQQQIAQQQQMTHQQMEQKQNVIKSEGSNDIIENIKIEAKNVMVVIFLCIFFNVDQVDNLFKSQSMFLNESGSINMQAVFIKALLIGVIFYVAKTYLL